jgi:hypothetical protein
MRILATLFIFLINISFSQNSSFEGILKYRTITTLKRDFRSEQKEKFYDTTYTYVLLKEGNRIEISDSLNNFRNRRTYIKSHCEVFIFKNDSLNDVYQIEDDKDTLTVLKDSLLDKYILREECFGISYETDQFNAEAYFSKQKLNGYDYESSCPSNDFNLEFKHIVYFYKKVFKRSETVIEVELVECIEKELDPKLFVIPNFKNLHITKE